MLAPAIQAGPTGGNIVGGVGHIHNNGLNTVIHQDSSSLAINWDQFNINRDERVQFLQPNASSISLNRILDNSRSEILGRIDANGQVILVNPNGLFFGAGSQVNVGSLIASGLDIIPSDFMNGAYIFNEVLGSQGTVVNRGLLNAATGGSISLIGQQVRNEGLISARLGQVNMAVGRQAYLTFDSAGFLGVTITEEILQDELGIDPALLNSGEINAAGGQVLLTAQASRDVFAQAVNSGNLSLPTQAIVEADGSISFKKVGNIVNSGRINVSSSATREDAGRVVIQGANIEQTGSIFANSETGAAGSIELNAGDKVELKGVAVVSARAEQSGTGGNIKILGNKVGLFDNSTVDASGASGGGEVLVGGDQQGQNSAIRNAEFLYLGENSRIYADALDIGRGGKIIAFADNTARVYGNLFARGGVRGGNGGFIETSGKQGFEILTAPDISARAEMGKGGVWLIDPRNINIVDTGDSNISPPEPLPNTPSVIYTATGDTATLGVDTLLAALVNGSVVIYTDDNTGGTSGTQAGNITFDANLDYNGIGRGNSLTLRAFNNIDFQDGASIIDSAPGLDSLGIVLEANNGGTSNTTGTGSITFGNSTLIDTRGANFTASGNSFNSGAAIIDVRTGSIDLDGISGAVRLGDLTANGFVTSNLFIQNASTITQEVDTSIDIAQDLFLGGLFTTEITLDQSSNSFGGNIVVKANTATITGTGRIRLNTGTEISNTLNVTSTNGGTLDIADGGFITVDNTSDNATATFNTTGNITFSGSNNFNRVNIQSGARVTLNDSTGGIALSANSGAGAGGVTGNLTVSASGGDITDFGEINIEGTTNLSVDQDRDILLGNTANTLAGIITLTALNNVGGNGNFGNVTLRNTSAINLQSLRVNNNLFLTGDAVNLSRGGNETTAANLTVNTTSANPRAGNVITQSGALNITGNTVLAVAEGATQNILLNNPNNDFSVIDINVDNNGTLAANNVTLIDVDEIFLDDITVNNLIINAGINYAGSVTDNIILNASTVNSNITVTGTTTLTARNTTSGQNYSINLDSMGNNFNDVNVVNGFDVTLSDNVDTLNVQSTNPLNTFNVISTATAANGSTINNIGAAGVTVNGAATFIVADGQSINLNGNNRFNTDPIFLSVSGDLINNLTLNNLTDFTLQDNFTSQGDLNITANNITLQNTTVGNAINLNATAENNSQITQLNAPVNAPDSLVVAGQSTFNARIITLDNTGNDFQGAVMVDNALATVRLTDSAGGIQVGDTGGVFNSASLNIISTGGDITQASAINTGDITLDAGASDILFNSRNNNNFTGNISIDNARDARINNRAVTTLKTARIANALVINSGGEIKQTDTASILTVGGNTQLRAQDVGNVDQNITLNNITNQFSTVDILNAANVDVYDSAGALGIQGNVSGFLNIQSAGQDSANSVIFNTGELNVIGTATFSVVDGESIDLGHRANTFSIDPVFNGAINNLTLSDDTALEFQNNLTLAGDLSVDAQGITQAENAALNIAGLANFNGNAGGIRLTGDNDFKRTVTLNTRSGNVLSQPSDVLITDTNSLDLGASVIAGSLSVIAQDMTQTDNLTPGNAQGLRVANNAQFTVADGRSVSLNNVDNQFTSLRIATRTEGAFLSDVIVSNRDTLDLQAINVTNNLTLTSLDGITGSGALVVNGLTQLSGTTITLDNVANDLSTINISNAAQVTLVNRDSVNFTGTSNITETFNLRVQNGNISSDASSSNAGASIRVGNNSVLRADNGEIQLDNGLHDFNSVQLNASGNARISDINGIDIRSSTIGGDLNISTGTGNNNVNNDIVNTNGTIDVRGSTTLQSVDGANIFLARTGSLHALNGPVSMIARGEGQLNSVQLNNGVATNLQTINTRTLQLTSAGDITDSGAIRVSGNATLSTEGDIDLSTPANETLSNNNIGNLTVQSARNVSIGNGGALMLNALNTNGQLSVQANGLTTTADLLASTGIDLNAGSGALMINNNLSTSTGVLNLTADQDITQRNGTRINGPQISLNARMGRINQNGNIIQSGAPATELLPVVGVDVQAGDAIVMSGGATTQAENDIRYVSNNDQRLTSLNSTAGAIRVESGSGAIIDANGNADNFIAQLVNLRALTGIGSFENSIETRTAELDVINAGSNQGIIDIKNTGDVLLTKLINSGDINFNNNTNVTLDTVVADFSLAGADGGTVNGGNFFFTVESGSVLGVNRGPGVEFLTIPDITADSAQITVVGSFGTFQRPIVLELRSSLQLLSSISNLFFLGGPPTTVRDNSAIQLSISDSLNNVSGQQLIEVESLADIDPAIFTDLRHYNSEEIAVRLPRDQIFEDELQEYDVQ